MILFSALLLTGAMVTAEQRAATKPKSKVKTTVVHLLLDMSGSMAERKAETIAAYNEYIQSLQASDDTDGFSFTFSRFNSIIGVKKIVEQSAMKDVPHLTDEMYRPAAVTPLYDAIGRTIHEADKQAGKDDGVLIVIQTGGIENASQEYSKDAVKNLIQDRITKGWQFVYLGCDLDAMGQGAAIGIPQGNTISYDNKTTRQAYGMMAQSTRDYARSGSVATSHFAGSKAVDLRGQADVKPQAAQAPRTPTVTPSKPSKPSTWADA